MNNLIWIFKEIIYLGATASILILIILLMKKIFNKALSPKWHYYIWILLLMRLLVPFSLQSSMSVYTLFYTAAEKTNVPISDISFLFQGNSLNESSTSNIKTLPEAAPIVTNKNTTNSKVSGSVSYIVVKIKEIQNSNIAIILMAFIWLTGVLLLSFYTLFINIAFAVNVHKRYTSLKNRRLNDILEDCKNIMKIKHPIPLLTSKKVRTPSLYGFFNTKILVSEGYMEQLSDAEIKYIFLHELSHYKRKDIAINWLLALLQIFYFFNPLIWYAFYKIHEDCEVSCDAAALRYINEVEYQSYGSTIIKLIKLFSESNFIPVTAGLSKNKSSYKRRIIMISKFKKSKWTNTLLALILIISIGFIGLTGCKPVANKASNNNTIVLENQNKEVFYGNWVIKQVLAYGLGTYSTEDTKQLLGKSLLFSEDKANNFGDQASDITKVATNPVYKKNVISKIDFLTNYRMTFEKLGIKADSITEITVSDSKGIVCVFLVKDDNTLILIGGGTYFELVRKTL